MPTARMHGTEHTKIALAYYKKHPKRLPFLLEAISEEHKADKNAPITALIASVKWWLKIAEETK
jgi:hypothetical protein